MTTAGGGTYWPYNAIFCCYKFHAEQHYETHIPPLEGVGGSKACEADGELWRAADRGDVARVLRAVQQGADVNFQHSSGTPLGRAARRGHLHSVEALLRLGADVNLTGRYNCRSCTTLHAGAAGGHAEVVRTLLRHGADLQATDEQGNTALHDACRHGHLDVVVLLLEEGARVNRRNDCGETPLLLAVREGRLDGLRWLLEAVVDYYHYRGHCYNADFYPSEAVRLLLDRRDQVQGLDLPVLTSLRAALLNDSLQEIQRTVQRAAAGDPATLQIHLVRLLLEKGADAEVRDDRNSSALHHAVYGKNEACVDLLLRHGALIDRPGSIYGWSSEPPLHLAAGFYGSGQMVQVLVHRGADVNARDCEGCTALHAAVKYGHAARVQTLLTGGADVGSLDAAGRSPLHVVRTLDCAELLVAHGADVKALTRSGRTVLFAASDRTGEGACVRFLIERGADPLARDRDSHESALDLAVQRYYLEDKFDMDDGGVDSVRVLMEHGARLDASRLTGSVDVALRQRCLGRALALLRHGVRAEQGLERLLLRAVSTRFPAGVALLLEEGARVGTAPLELALTTAREECARVLVEQGARVSAGFHAVKLSPGLVKLAAQLGVRDQDGSGLVHRLCHTLESPRALEQLLQTGADASLADDDGTTGLHVLALKGCEGARHLAELLLAAGADVSARDRDGLTPLHCTGFRGHVKMAELLLEHGAGPDLQDGGGRTVLHIAAEHLPDDDSDYVDLLLRRGASVLVRNVEGWTSLHEAARGGRLQVVEKLVRQGLTDDGSAACVQDTWDVSALFRGDVYYKVQALLKHVPAELFVEEDDSDDDMGFGLFD